ncbi:MAG: carbohydrate kinase family protein [Anaerolineales bacterium]
MAKQYDVIVVGDYCLDLIFSGLPSFLELGKEVVARDFAMVGGGTYNTAVALHRLGVKVGWATDFGNDLFSKLVLEMAEKDGLDNALFVQHTIPLRRITVSASLSNDRAFVAFYDDGPTIPAAIKALTSASAKVLYIPALYTGPAFDLGLPLVRARHIQIVMDGNSYDDAVLKDPKVRKALKNCTIFMPNRAEACRITALDNLEQAMYKLGELIPLVVVKDGANGAFACQDGKIIHVDSIPVHPVDTTGAGDCFNAGFLKAWLEGQPLEECLRWGNIVGGLSTLGYGGSGKIITEQDVRAYL